jgi:lysophospholipase L1-like esterase
LIAAGLILAVHSALYPAAASAAEPAAPKTVYVAFGDSLTSGHEPGLAPEAYYGFADRLYEQSLFYGRTLFANYGINGLRTEGLREYVRAIGENRPVSAEQIQPGLKDPRAAQRGANVTQAREHVLKATLITITIGGNDFMELLLSAPSWPQDKIDAVVEEKLQQYTDNMTAVLDELTRLNPDAQIVIADQYFPIPSFLRSYYEKLSAIKDLLTSRVEQLAQSYAEQGYRVTAVRVSDAFIGNEGAYTYILQRDIHPNQRGYEAMARAFAEAIWGEYRQISPREPGVPLTVVVDGKELNTPYKPVVVQGRTFVAIKDIVLAMGATLHWDAKTETATILYNGIESKLKIGSSTMYVNKQSVAVDVPAFLHTVGKEKKTYVPLAVLAQGLGFDVQYRSKIRTVFVNR